MENNTIYTYGCEYSSIVELTKDVKPNIILYVSTFEEELSPSISVNLTKDEALKLAHSIINNYK